MLKRTKTVLVGTVAVASVCTGCYMYGSYKAIDSRMEQLQADNQQQQEYIEYLKAEGIKYEKFVNSVSMDTELVLLTEDGIINTVIENGTNFLTKTKTEFAIEYSVKLGIKTHNIHFAKRGTTVIATINKDDIEVNSLEVINKNILLHNKKLFGNYMNQAEKNAAEKLICEKAKEEVLNKHENITMAVNTLTDYLSGLAEAFDVDIEIYFS